MAKILLVSSASQEKNSEPTFSGFAQRLRELRKQKQLSQLELAKRSGVHNVNLSRYERGLAEPSGESIRRIAEALEVSVAHLIEGVAKELPSSRLEDLELRQQLLEIERLSEEDRQVVKRFLDAFLFRKRIQDLAGAPSQQAV